MSHDELVARVNKLEDSYDTEGYAWGALKAVVELHKPYNSVNACTFDDLDYPCPTIQAIEKGLI